MPGTDRSLRPRADRARQIAEVLRRQVGAGAFTSGVLPDERHLIADFGASRNAVRDALRMLCDEGLVARRPGVGTVVLARPYDHGLGRLTGLAKTLHEHGAVTNEVREARMVRAPGATATRLGLADDATVGYLERLCRLGDLPLPPDLTYLAPDVGEPLLAAERLSRLAGGRPVDLEFLRIRGDRLTLHGELPRA